MKVYDKPYREDPHNEIVSATRQGIYLTCGSKGSGKSATQSLLLTELFERGWTVFDLWSAGLEAMFYCVNLDCAKRREERIQKIEHELRIANMREDKQEVYRLETKLHDVKNRLGCRCHKRYPITVLCSQAIDVDRLSLDKINGIYYTKEEWVKKMQDKGEIIVEYDDHNPPIKPESERGTEWIRIVKLPFAKKTEDAKENKEILSIVEKVLLESRQERRILVYVPTLFPDDFSRYKTLAVIITGLPDITRKHFKPNTVADIGLPKSKWSKEQRNHHQLAVLMRELAETAPSEMMTNQFANLTKRAVLSIIFTSRHSRITILFDLQRIEDAFKKIRAQITTIILKRTPNKMLGEELYFVKDWIEQQHQNSMKKIRVRNKDSMDVLYSRLPPLEKLNFNYCYAVYSDDWIQKWKIPSCHHHHKQENDDLTKLIGFDYSIDWTIINKAKEGKTHTSNVNDSVTNEFISFIDDAMALLKGKKGSKWKEIHQMLIKEQEKGRFQSFGMFAEKQHGSVRKQYERLTKGREDVGNNMSKTVQSTPIITS
ncbi:MAG: hypothetical protein K5793_03750 [Nitrosarchaeum sp.]|nr:hypothetical protein [Nitrosarchaeum sp.]